MMLMSGLIGKYRHFFIKEFFLSTVSYPNLRVKFKEVGITVSYILRIESFL